MLGLRVAAGDFVGVRLELVGLVAAGVAIGNANVCDGDTDGAADTPGEGDCIPLGVAEGLDTVLGVGEGGMIFSQ